MLLLAIVIGLLTPSAAGAKVKLQRDSGGVPHVTAKTWRGLGLGGGFAFAQDNLCRLANDFVTVRAERSRFFGPEKRSLIRSSGADDSNLASDFFYQRIKDERIVERLLARKAPFGPAPQTKRLVAGYAQGYNRFLRSKRFRDPACAGKPWVRPVSELDVWRRIYQLILIASGGRFITDQVDAAPPSPARVARSATQDRGIDAEKLRQAIGEVADPAVGSNVFAIGRSGMRSEQGRGLIVANSHLPWPDSDRLWEQHQRIPGKFNVWGASLFGSPLVNEGYNGKVAWATTDSTTRRFTFFELELAPDDPTAYLVDGKRRKMTTDRVTVRVKTPSGLKTHKHTFFKTRYGLVSNLSEAGYRWSKTTAYALGDVNADNLRAANTYLELGKADTVGQVRRALTSTLGLPWINTMAVDRSGRTFYGDIGPVPNVGREKLASCTPQGLPALAFAQARLITLDGSRASCGWDTDKGSLIKGRFGPGKLPQLHRKDYVENSNDSYWLTNVKRPLEGFSPIIGLERVAQGTRTRVAQLDILARLRGKDGQRGRGFDLRAAKRLVLSNRSLGAELTRDALVAYCRANPRLEGSSGQTVDVSEACPALAAYNLTGNLKSPGGWLFAEWWRRTSGTAAGFWADAFDPAQPLTTPNQLRIGAGTEQSTALADAVANLRANTIPMDASFGGVQHVTKGSKRIPIPGCRMGCFNTIFAANGGPDDVGDYGEVQFGSSAIFAIELRKRGARGASTSAHSQATDRTSPYYADGARRFSRKQWKPIRFTKKQIKADPKLRTTTLKGR